MMDKPPEVKSINIKKYEHLKEGVLPIMACVGTMYDYKKDKKIQRLFLGKKIPNVHDVDFDAHPLELKKVGFENDGEKSYVISVVDGLDKYSKRYYDCTGLIIAGKEKETGKNISFMSHQNPSYFLKENKFKFSTDLVKQIQAIKNRCEEGTIDAVIFGGRYAKVIDFKDSDPKRDMFMEEYLKSIKLVSQRVKDALGFEPLVITGPKTIPGTDRVFYDNENRRLYLIRENDDFDSVQSFSPSELEERRKNWKPGEWGLPFKEI